MGKLIKNNFGNFLAIGILAILVLAGIFYYSSVNIKGAESREIKILPTMYSGSWQNPEKALVIDLIPEAGFDEFNKENSAVPIEIEVEEPSVVPDGTMEGKPSSPSEPEEEMEEILTSPSETSLRNSRRIPFVLVIIKNLTRASADLFGIGNLAASESEPDEDTQSVMPLVDISTLLDSESGEVEGVSTESEEGEAIYVPLIPLDELEEMVSTAEEVATESAEELATESEAIVSEVESPQVIEFAPGFVESVLEFSGFDVPVEFTGENSDGKEIKNIQLRMSLAFEGGGPQDSLIIEYAAETDVGGETSYVGGFASYMDWRLLAELYTSDPNSNATNNGYWLYGLPIFENWEDLKNLKIRIKYRGFLPASPSGGPDPMAEMGIENQPKGKVYLDAIWLEVDYEKKVEELATETLQKNAELKTRKLEKEIRLDNNSPFECGVEPFAIHLSEDSAQRTTVILRKKGKDNLLEIGNLPIGVDIRFVENNDYLLLMGDRNEAAIEIYSQVGSQKGNFSVPIIYQSGNSTTICQINLINF